MYVNSTIIIFIMYSIESLPDQITTDLKLTPRSSEAMGKLGLRLEDLAVRDRR